MIYIKETTRDKYFKYSNYYGNVKSHFPLVVKLRRGREARLSGCSTKGLDCPPWESSSSSFPCCAFSLDPHKRTFLVPKILEMWWWRSFRTDWFEITSSSKLIFFCFLKGLIHTDKYLCDYLSLICFIGFIGWSDVGKKSHVILHTCFSAQKKIAEKVSFHFSHSHSFCRSSPIHPHILNFDDHHRKRGCS